MGYKLFVGWVVFFGGVLGRGDVIGVVGGESKLV